MPILLSSTTFVPHSDIFFFLPYSYPLLLHSFPTRRSSDLLRCARRAGEIREPGAVARPGPAVRRRLISRDRKSTRLNSSHRCISYAVFCLKKKNLIY